MAWRSFFGRGLLFLLPVMILYALVWGYCKPLLTNSVSFDAKVFEVDRLKLKHVDIMAVGSSVTLNDLNTKIIKDCLHKSYYNFSSWGLQIPDDYKLIVNNVDKYSPKYLIMTTTFADFILAENNTLAKKFDLNNTSSMTYYVKNYNNLESIISRWHDLKTYRKGNDEYTGLKFDDGGGIGLQISKQNQNIKRVYDAKAIMKMFPNKFTNPDYLILNKIAAFLQSKNIILVFVQAPYASSVIESKTMLNAINDHFDKCKAIVESHKGIYLNKEVITNIPDSLFADPLHLSKSGSIVFTKKIVANLSRILK